MGKIVDHGQTKPWETKKICLLPMTVITQSRVCYILRDRLGKCDLLIFIAPGVRSLSRSRLHTEKYSFYLGLKIQTMSCSCNKYEQIRTV